MPKKKEEQPVISETEINLLGRQAELEEHLDWMNKNGFSRTGNIQVALSQVNRELDSL